MPMHVLRERMLNFNACIGNGKWRVGSICSGSDMEMVSLKTFACIVGETLGIVTSDVQQVYSCEIIRFKRKFIQYVWSPDHIFMDAIAMGKEHQ